MSERSEAGNGLRNLRVSLRELYEGDSTPAHRFRYAVLAFDLTTILFLIVSSFFPPALAVEVLGALIGFIILMDFAVRLWISRRPLHDLIHPAGLADVIAIISFLAPIWGGGFAFVRVVRMLRLLHAYEVLERLGKDVPLFQRHQDISLATIHLAIFLFVMTALVYETQHRANPEIGNYVDALYFTVTTLTTTGFGDITLPGTTGRLLAVMIMIFGVSLFLRLVQVVLRPSKVRYECPDCGLLRHDIDAVHCKHCGTTLRIPNEGET